MAKWFQTAIHDTYALLLEKSNLNIQAISVVKYPIYFVSATIKAYVDDDNHALDYQVLKVINHFDSCDEDLLNIVIGVRRKVIKWRLDALSQANYITISKSNIILTKLGMEILNNPKNRIENIYTETYYIDGITLEPLPKEYYEHSNHHGALHCYIEHGDSYFKSDIIHTPPSDEIIKNISAVEIDKREDYSISKGLIDIINIDPLRLIHPIGMMYASNDQGKVVKRLIDCCDKKPNSKMLAKCNETHLDKINGLHINISQYKKFSSDWNIDESNYSGSFFKFKEIDLLSIINKQLKTKIKDTEDIIFHDHSLSLKIDAKYFDLSNDFRGNLLNCLKRKIYYLPQHESTSVWLVVLQIYTEDPFVEDMLKLNEALNSKVINWVELIEKYKYSYLRDLIISSKKYSELEDLDSQVFLMDYINGEVVNPRIKVDI